MTVANKTSMRQDISTEDLNKLIIDGILDLKGKDIIQLNLKALEEASTDFFIICHGESHTQVNAIADHIIGRIKKETGLVPFHMEGRKNANWVLIDYFDTVVHIFHKETRDFYKLENLWSDAELTSFES